MTMSLDARWAMTTCEQAGLLTIDPRNPTRAIIAALGTAVAGIVPPMERHCVIRGAAATDSLWSVGAHPFGFATRDTAFSQVSSNSHGTCASALTHALLPILSVCHAASASFTLMRGDCL